jgi:hypothetical protein
MIRKLVHISGTALMTVLLFASSGLAQTFDVSGGYAWLREEDLTVPKGWYAAAGVNLNDSFAVFGQLSQHTKTLDVSGVDVDTKLTIWGAGPRITGNQRSAVTYFAQALLGGAKSSASVSGISGHGFQRQQFRRPARRRRGYQGRRRRRCAPARRPHVHQGRTRMATGMGVPDRDRLPRRLVPARYFKPI